MPNNSVANIAPEPPRKNTYINFVPGDIDLGQDNNLIFDTKNEITLPTVLPDPITPPGGNVEAKDFLVQKPLMPTVKKDK